MQRLPAIVFTAATLVVLAFAAQASPPAAKADRVQVSPGVGGRRGRSDHSLFGGRRTTRAAADGRQANGVVRRAVRRRRRRRDGLVTVFAPGELRVGAIVNGKTGWATVRIKPQQVARGRHRAARPRRWCRARAPGSRRRHLHRERHPAAWRAGDVAVGVAVGGNRRCGGRRDRPGARTRGDRAPAEQGSGTTTLTVDRERGRRASRSSRAPRRRAPATSSASRRAPGRQKIPCVQWSLGGDGRDDRSRRRVRRRASGHLHRHGHRRQPRDHSQHCRDPARNVQRALELVGRTPARGVPDARAVGVRQVPVCHLRDGGQAVGATTSPIPRRP